MNQPATLAVVGGDIRQVHLAGLLCADGHTVRTFALERHSISGCAAVSDPRSCFINTQAVILPLPVQHGSSQLNAPLANAHYPLADILDAIPAGTLTLAGAIPFWAHAHAVQNDLRMLDYLTRDELAIRNAVPTCEGALQLAMEHTAYTIQRARCLVIGYGRIGAMLAHKLRALDAHVTVSARSPRDFAHIETQGMQALDTRQLAGQLSHFDLIFNTVPAPVLGAAELAGLTPPCLIIDLASLPGGISPEAQMPPGCDLLHALSLPGKVAPRTAALAIYDTICTILHEEGIL